MSYMRILAAQEAPMQEDKRIYRYRKASMSKWDYNISVHTERNFSLFYFYFFFSAVPLMVVWWQKLNEINSPITAGTRRTPVWYLVRRKARQTMKLSNVTSSCAKEQARSERASKEWKRESERIPTVWLPAGKMTWPCLWPPNPSMNPHPAV